jgi:hypothetical protein
MTLHEAMARILNDGRTHTASEIAAKINKQKLYIRKDGQPLRASQVSARAKNYPGLFVRTAGRIRLA